MLNDQQKHQFKPTINPHLQSRAFRIDMRWLSAFQFPRHRHYHQADKRLDHAAALRPNHAPDLAVLTKPMQSMHSGLSAKAVSTELFHRNSAAMSSRSPNEVQMDFNPLFLFHNMTHQQIVTP